MLGLENERVWIMTCEINGTESWKGRYPFGMTPNQECWISHGHPQKLLCGALALVSRDKNAGTVATPTNGEKACGLLTALGFDLNICLVIIGIKNQETEFIFFDKKGCFQSDKGSYLSQSIKKLIYLFR